MPEPPETKGIVADTIFSEEIKQYIKDKNI